MYKMETRITWLIRYVYDFKKKGRRIIAYVAKKLMDNDIFLVMAKKYSSVVVITIMFLCFDVKV